VLLLHRLFLNPEILLNEGNIIKPKEATACPKVSYALTGFESDPSSLWTLVMTNPDGHFTDENSEYLHWMVANIPGNNVESGKIIASYLQPFPAFGTGYHRYIFVLYKQVNILERA
jgi:large subunit ribosomal protein L38